MSDRIPWTDLSRERKEAFAELCDRFVGIESIEDAKQYYGDKEKLLSDAQEATENE